MGRYPTIQTLSRLTTHTRAFGSTGQATTPTYFNCDPLAQTSPLIDRPGDPSTILTTVKLRCMQSSPFLLCVPSVELNHHSAYPTKQRRRHTGALAFYDIIPQPDDRADPRSRVARPTTTLPLRIFLPTGKP